MATPFRIKRSAVPNKKPQVSDLQLGELALNTHDAELYTLRALLDFQRMLFASVRVQQLQIFYMSQKTEKTPTRVKNLATPKQQSKQQLQSPQQSQDQLLKFLLELT